jgi:hypothetical protein
MVDGVTGVNEMFKDSKAFSGFSVDDLPGNVLSVLEG